MLAIRKLFCIGVIALALCLISLPVQAQSTSNPVSKNKKICDSSFLEEAIANTIGRARSSYTKSDQRIRRSIMNRLNRILGGYHKRFNAACDGNSFPDELVPADLEGVITGGGYTGPGDTVPPAN